MYVRRYTNRLDSIQCRCKAAFKFALSSCYYTVSFPASQFGLIAGPQFGTVWEAVGHPLLRCLSRQGAPDYERNTAAEAIGEIVTAMVSGRCWDRRGIFELQL